MDSIPSAYYKKYPTTKTQKAIEAVKKYGATEENLENLRKHYVIFAEGNILTMPHGFGVLIVMAVATSGFVFYTWYNSRCARDDYKVPQIYCHHPKFHVFNCVFRAYKSTHELHQRFLFYLIFSGLEWPWVSSAAAFAWMYGRFFYCRGYYSGNVANRFDRWYWHYIGFHIAQYGCLRFALKRLFW